MRHRREPKANHQRRVITLCSGALVALLLWPAAPAASAVPAERPAVKVVTPSAERRQGDLRSPGRNIVVAREAPAVGHEEVPGCRPISGSHARLKLNLKPETEITDLVAWIASITCRQFLVPGTVLAGAKKVTVYAPQPITRDGAYQLFLTALDSVGLTVQESGKFLRIIETSKAKSSAVPLFGFSGEPLSSAR